MGLHRLTALEYDASLQALLGITSNPSSQLPAQGTRSYDNVASNLSGTTPELLEKFLNISEPVVDEAFENSRAHFIDCPGNDGTEGCARETLSKFARRAFRRRISSEEVDSLWELVNSEAVFDDGMKLAVRAIISSPSFLFRAVEAGPQGTVRRLNGYEVATRLSYFLMGGPPSEALLDTAESGVLDTNEGIREQVRTFFADPQAVEAINRHLSEMLADKYALFELDEHVVDDDTFPEFSEELRDDMMTESRMFVRYVIEENLPPLAMISGEFTFLNERLADHYGIPGVQGDEFRKVSLGDVPRRGILTQGSILTMNSAAHRTSIIRRGTWVLENILCSVPPTPDGDFTPVPNDFEGTRREVEEAQRSSSGCASCHDVIDPPGFALDQFDAIGQFRTTDGNGLPIDTSGSLADGTTFDDSLGLIAAMAASPDSASCMAEHLLSYATGQVFGDEDVCNPEAVAKRGIEEGQSFEDLVVAIVTNKAFLGYEAR